MSTSEVSNLRFDRLFRDHRDAVWSYCSRRVGADEAADAVAEVFLVVWRRIDDIPDGDESLVWMYGVARNVIRNSVRSAIRRHRLHDRLKVLREQVDLEPEVQVIRASEDRELLAAVSRLKPLEREMLRLRTWEELSFAEIGQVLGLSERTVAYRLKRVREKLQGMLFGSSLRTRLLGSVSRDGAK